MPDNFEEYNKIVDETWNKVHQLSHLKGGEYAGDKDRLANFRRNAEALGLSMETVWAVYAAKHWDAVMQYIKDIAKRTTRVRSEPIEGRIDDLIVYLLLFKLIIRDQSVNVPELSFPNPPNVPQGAPSDWMLGTDKVHQNRLERIDEAGKHLERYGFLKAQEEWLKNG